MSSIPARTSGPRRALLQQPIAVPLIYAATLGLVEAALIAPGHVLAGQIMDGLVVLLLVNSGSGPARGEAVAIIDEAVPALRVLTVVALVRVVAIGLPLRDGSRGMAELLVALLTIAAAVGVAPLVAVPLKPLIALRDRPLQRRAFIAGLILGLVAYLIGAPRLWPAGASGLPVLVALAGSAAGACAEELLFRGLTQLTFQRIAPRAGVAAAALLYAAFNLGAGSPELVLVLALAGVVFSRVVDRTESLFGAIAGHVALAIGAGGVWPALFGGVGVSHSAIVTCGLVIVLAGAAARMLSAAATAPAAGRDTIRTAAPSPDGRPLGSPRPRGRVTSLARQGAGRRGLRPRGAVRPEAVRRGPVPPPAAGRQLPPGDVEAVLLCARRVGLPELLSPDSSWNRDLCVAAVVQAVLAPSRESVPLTARRAKSRPAELQRALAWLAERRDEIERRLAARHLPGSAQLPLYDVRGTAGETYGVLCDHHARPLASVRHADRDTEPAPLAAAITALRTRLHLGELIVTGDRGDAADLAELVEIPWVGWILAVDPSAPVELIPGEELVASRRQSSERAALRIGGAARRLGGARAALRFREVTNPALRFAPRAPTGATDTDEQELVTSLLAGYVAWHLSAAWRELESESGSLTDVLTALGPHPTPSVGALDPAVLRERALALLDAYFE